MLNVELNIKLKKYSKISNSELNIHNLTLFTVSVTIFITKKERD